MNKPWPSDAVMIVAANVGNENPANMEGVVRKECRDCGQPLAVDTFTINHAIRIPQRHGRPIKYFCTECATKYDRDSITHFEDHRK